MSRDILSHFLLSVLYVYCSINNALKEKLILFKKKRYFR